MTYNGAELEVRKNLAATIDTPVKILQQLSEETEAEVRYLVAGNPNTPIEVLQKLGEEFPEAVTANPVFNLLALENPDSRFIKLSLARSSTTSQETLAKLVETEEDDKEILCAVAKNIATHINTLKKLIDLYPINDENDEYQDEEYTGRRIHVNLTENQITPVELLEKLAVHKSDMVRQKVAKHQNTSSVLLDKLARDREAKIRQAVASNPKTPSSALEYLAGEDDWNSVIRNIIVEHPNISDTALEIIRFVQEKPGTPVYLLEQLANDNRINIRRLVAEHPFTPTHALDKLAEETDSFVLHRVISHPNLSTETLEKITFRLVDEFKIINYRSNPNSGNLQIFINLIQHKRITDKALLKLASLETFETARSIAYLDSVPPEALAKVSEYKGNGFDLHFWGILAANPNTPGEILEKLFILISNVGGHPNEEEYLYDIVRHSNTPIHILDKIASGHNKYLQKAVASNSSISLNILCKLADTASDNYGISIANSEDIPIEIWMLCAVSKNDNIRQGIAKNLKTPIIVLEKLANDNNPWVRANVAQNPRTPTLVIEDLATDPAYQVAEGVTKNPHITAEILELFVDSRFEEVLLNVALHPNTSAQTLLKLVEDDDFEIRKHLASRTDIPEAAIEKLVDKSLNEIIRKTKLHYEEDEYDILCRIAVNPNTKVPVLEQLALNLPCKVATKLSTYLSYIQKAVTMNVNTPISVLEKLAEYSCELTREAAIKALKAKY